MNCLKLRLVKSDVKKINMLWMEVQTANLQKAIKSLFNTALVNKFTICCRNSYLFAKAVLCAKFAILFL